SRRSEDEQAPYHGGHVTGDLGYGQLPLLCPQDHELTKPGRTVSLGSVVRFRSFRRAPGRGGATPRPVTGTLRQVVSPVRLMSSALQSRLPGTSRRTMAGSVAALAALALPAGLAAPAQAHTRPVPAPAPA